MSSVAKRKLWQSWREAVAARAAAFGVEAACLARFDEAVDSGAAEHVGAYHALKAEGCLWLLELDMTPGRTPDVASPDETAGTVPQP